MGQGGPGGLGAPQGGIQPGAMGQPQMGGPRPVPGAPPSQSQIGAGSIGPGTTPPRMPQAQPQMTPGGPGAMGQKGPGGLGTPQGAMQPGPARRPTQ